VTAVRTWTGLQRMHDLTISDTHTYYVLAGTTPVLVHNSDGNGFDVPRLYDGQFWGFGWDTPAGRVDGYAIVEVNDSHVSFHDVALYGPGRKSVGAGDMLGKLRGMVAPAVANQGFTKMTVSWERTTPGPTEGHTFSKTWSISPEGGMTPC
jgi:hypothetical protein